MDLIKIREQLNLGISLTKIKLRVTNYSRVSTDHQEQLTSLKNQKKYFDDYINGNPNWEYIEGYIDEGISGTTDYKRNNFMKMIEDAKNNKFDLIITKEISRFSRNTLDSIKYTRELLNYGVAVLFINDNINTALPDAELRLTIMSSLAQDEIRRLSERVKFGMQQSIINGKILGNNKLYGYKKDKENNKLIIIEEQAKIIREIYELYIINNYSLNKISKILNNKNLNKKFNNTTISRIIKNPKYKGYYCGKKSEVIDYMSKKIKKIPENNWIIYKDNNRIPPIVSEEIWSKANKKIEKRNIKFGDHNNKIIYKNRYPLSAKIICLNDQEFFHRRKQCKDDISWVCSKYLKEGKKYCNSQNIREKELYAILNNIFSYIGINKNKLIDKLNLYYKNNNRFDIDNQLFLNQLMRLILFKIEVKTIDKCNLKLNIFLNIKNSIKYNKSYIFYREKYSVNFYITVLNVA